MPVTVVLALAAPAIAADPANASPAMLAVASSVLIRDMRCPFLSCCPPMLRRLLSSRESGSGLCSMGGTAEQILSIGEMYEIPEPDALRPSFVDQAVDV